MGGLFGLQSASNIWYKLCVAVQKLSMNLNASWCEFLMRLSFFRSRKGHRRFVDVPTSHLPGL